MEPYPTNINDTLIQSLSKGVLNLGNECRALAEENARLKAEVDAVRKYWKATGEGVNRYVGKSIALEDEVTRLKAEVERRGDENAHLHKGIYSLSLNVAQLKDEVERLTDFTTRTIIPNEELEAENARLKAEVELLKGKVNYWKIEAECDHGRWLRTLEDLEHLRNLK